MFNLDEAIKHYEEVMIENLEKTKDRNASDPIAINCFECAEEHRQLAEWLKELKDYRERMPSYEAGYNDAKREIALSGEYERAYERGKADAIQALQEPTGDLISRQAVLDEAFEVDTKEYGRIEVVGVDAINSLSSVKLQEPKWIPVSERLPQINEWVLCQCRAGYKVLRLTSYGCYCNDTQEYMDSFVIAWMPLPKPYKKGANE